MHGDPSLQELISAVKGFLDSDAMAELSGHSRFSARIASNVLATALRELDQRPGAEASEKARLLALLEGSTEADTLDALQMQLISKIRSGGLDETDADLIAHLKETAIAQLNIDQPKYSGVNSKGR